MFVSAAYKREPKCRSARAQKHLLLFRIAILNLLDDLTHHWRWLCLEHQPRSRARARAGLSITKRIRDSAATQGWTLLRDYDGGGASSRPGPALDDARH